MIERCGDRQRKCDGLKKRPFHLFVESLSVMLQIALLLLSCGLCRHMASINDFVAVSSSPLLYSESCSTSGSSSPAHLRTAVRFRHQHPSYCVVHGRSSGSTRLLLPSPSSLPCAAWETLFIVTSPRSICHSSTSCTIFAGSWG